MRKRFKRFMKKLKRHFMMVIQLKKSPHSIALGFAIGTFISLLPTPGFNILLGLLVTLIYTKVNKITLFTGIVFWSPILSIPTYTASYRIGNFIFGSEPVIRYNIVIWDQIYNFTRRFLVGNLILSISTAILSYGIIFLIAYLYQLRKD